MDLTSYWRARILATAASATTMMVVWMLPVGRSAWMPPSTMNYEMSEMGLDEK